MSSAKADEKQEIIGQMILIIFRLSGIPIQAGFVQAPSPALFVTMSLFSHILVSVNQEWQFSDFQSPWTWLPFPAESFLSG